MTTRGAEHETRDAPAGETDVLIIGAGPVGCALAVDLRLRGVRCAIVERDERISYDMRAMNNSMRTMEHMRQWGIAEQIRRCSRVPPEFRHDLVFATALHGQELGVFRAYGFRPEDARELASEPGVPMSQKYTAWVLRARAQELGCAVHTGWEFIDLEQSPDAVSVRIAPTAARDSTQIIRTSYLVGCDGGRSSVRASAGIPMTGAGALGKHVHAVVGCPALLEDLSVSPGCFYVLFNPEVGGLVLPSDVDEFNLHLAGYDPDEEITVAELESKARLVIGRDVEVEIKRVSPYLIHELTAETYRRERVLIAGDACHLFCPFGGFNMNTGIGDAANLGWKLAAVLAGWGGDALLDSYTDERRPIAMANCDAASANVRALVGSIGRILEEGIPDGDEEARRRLGERLYMETYSEWNTHGIVLDQRYTDSPVIVDDGSHAPPWDVTIYSPLAKPGHRLPHAWLADGVSLYDRLGPGLTLLDCRASRPPQHSGSDGLGADLLPARARCGARGRSRDVEEHLADRVLAHGVVRCGDLLEREAHGRQRTEAATGQRHDDVADGLAFGRVRHRVDEHEADQGVLGDHRARQLDRLVGSSVGGDLLMGLEDLGVELEVVRDGHLDDPLHAVGGPRADRGGRVLGSVVDDQLGARLAGQAGLLVGAHGGRHPGSAPAGELDRSVTDRPRPARDKYPRTLDRAHGKQTPVRSQRRNPKARTEVQQPLVGQRHRLFTGQGDPLGGRPLSPPPLREIEPHVLADSRRRHALADRDDLAGAVMTGHDLRVPGIEGASGARPHVRRVDSAHAEPHQDLPGAGLRPRQLHQPQLAELRPGGVVLRCQHPLVAAHPASA